MSWFEELGKEDIPLVGRKDANLGEMLQAKIPTTDSNARTWTLGDNLLPSISVRARSEFPVQVRLVMKAPAISFPRKVIDDGFQGSLFALRDGLSQKNRRLEERARGKTSKNHHKPCLLEDLVLRRYAIVGNESNDAIKNDCNRSFDTGIFDSSQVKVKRNSTLVVIYTWSENPREERKALEVFREALEAFCDKRGLPARFLTVVHNKRDLEMASTITGTALEIFFLLYFSKPDTRVGARGIQRALDLSSPSVALGALDKLANYGIVADIGSGCYILNKSARAHKIGLLNSYVRVSGHAVPKNLFLGAMFSILTALYILGFQSAFHDPDFMVGVAISLAASLSLWYQTLSTLKERPRGLSLALSRVQKVDW